MRTQFSCMRAAAYLPISMFGSKPQFFSLESPRLFLPQLQFLFSSLITNIQWDSPIYHIFPQSLTAKRAHFLLALTDKRSESLQAAFIATSCKLLKALLEAPKECRKQSTSILLLNYPTFATLFLTVLTIVCHHHCCCFPCCKYHCHPCSCCRQLFHHCTIL